MSHFMGVAIFLIGLSPTDFDSWRLTLNVYPDNSIAQQVQSVCRTNTQTVKVLRFGS